jgi:hypothetical protein
MPTPWRPTTVVRLTPARNRFKIQSDIARLSAGGGTNIFPALDQAYRDLSAAQARTKHVILLSDGQSPTDGISELIQVMAAEGITVSTVGLGPQADRALLEQASRLTGGAAQVEPTAVFDAGDDEGVEYHRELWPYLVALAVALMLLDLPLRRVRLFDRQFKAARQRRSSRGLDHAPAG